MKNIGEGAVTQTLSSGLIIRQDFRDSTRMAFYDTHYEGYEYATHGGTVFVVRYNNKYYGITAKHIQGKKDDKFSFSDLNVLNHKSGDVTAGIDNIFRIDEDNLLGEATGSDLSDILILSFVDDVDGQFFKDNAYIWDQCTIARSSKDDDLLIHACLKVPSKIDYEENEIIPQFLLQELRDNGIGSDPTCLRTGLAKIIDTDFQDPKGLSGAPVFNKHKKKLVGMVLRAGIVSDVLIGIQK